MCGEIIPYGSLISRVCLVNLRLVSHFCHYYHNLRITDTWFDLVHSLQRSPLLVDIYRFLFIVTNWVSPSAAKMPAFQTTVLATSAGTEGHSRVPMQECHDFHYSILTWSSKRFPKNKCFPIFGYLWLISRTLILSCNFASLYLPSVERIN